MYHDHLCARSFPHRLLFLYRTIIFIIVVVVLFLSIVVDSNLVPPIVIVPLKTDQVKKVTWLCAPANNGWLAYFGRWRVASSCSVF